MLLRQVDDFAFAVKTETIGRNIVNDIDQHLRIRIKYLGVLKMFNGMDITQTKYYIKLHCTLYITRIIQQHQWTEISTKLYPIPYPADNTYTKLLDTAIPPDTITAQQNLSHQYKMHYRQLIGEFIWPMIKCRPDISFHVTKLSQFMANPAEAHYQALRSIGSYLANTLDTGIYYWRDTPRQDLPEGDLPTVYQEPYTFQDDPASNPRFITAYADSDWGGIPVVIIFGDDYQLTPPCEDGAIDALFNQGYTEESKNGAYHFIQLGGTTMELEQIIRQNNDQEELRDVLRNTRVGHPSDNNVETILALHLNSGNFTMEEIEELESKALYVFANKKQMRQHNFERLKAQHSSENPIARLRVQAVSKGREINNLPKCFKQENDIDPIVNICRGAKVQLMGKNFEPDWGLYNGSIGTVKEIVFERDENPLDGTLPQYVLVDFPEYCGPPWLKDKPKWVPIPPVELQCQSHCCNVKFIPLTLAYAKTGHTFQGQSAGPGHVIPCIIIQPGSSKMEKLCPGLLYMLLSRGSTIGTPECRLTSSIFFIGDELTKDRIQNLTTTCKGETCMKIKRRTKWVNFLKKNKAKLSISKKERLDLINWANKTTIKRETLEKLIEDTFWRKSNTTNF